MNKASNAPTHPARRRIAMRGVLLAIAGAAIGVVAAAPARADIGADAATARRSTRHLPPPSGPRAGFELARREAYRVQRELSKRHFSAPEVLAARRDLQSAQLIFDQARRDALQTLRASDAYKSLRAQLWMGGDEVQELHDAYPPDREQILERARHNLEIRTQLTRLEQAALASDEQAEGARDELNECMRRYLDAVETAAMQVRNDPRMVDSSMRLRALRAQIAG